MLDVFAIYSGMTVTASGTPPVLWPDAGFPASGPSPEFLAANSAKIVLSNPNYDANFQKLVPAAPYVAGDGNIYDMAVVPLTADELTLLKRGKDTVDATKSGIGLAYRHAADLRAKGDDTSRLDAYDFLLKKGLPPWP